MRYEVREHRTRSNILADLYDEMIDRIDANKKRIELYDDFDHSKKYRIEQRLKTQKRAVVWILTAICREDEKFLSQFKK